MCQPSHKPHLIIENLSWKSEMSNLRGIHGKMQVTEEHGNLANIYGYSSFHLLKCLSLSQAARVCAIAFIWYKEHHANGPRRSFVWPLNNMRKELDIFWKNAKMLHGENNFTTWIIKVKNIFKTIVTSIYNPKYLVVRLVHHPLIFWNEKFKLARLHKLINKCWNNIKNSACSLFEKWRFICVNISWQI